MLKVSDNGVFKRDLYVLEFCSKKKVPVAAVIGGGYGSIPDLVHRHIFLHRAARIVWENTKALSLE